MSLGGDPAPALDQAVCRSLAAGVTYVVAAGNEGSDAETSSPARVVQAITVAASDRNDRKPAWSNWGSLVDVFAPGVEIESDAPGGGTATMSGTSMASPHVAGAAALVLGRSPGLNPETVAYRIWSSASVGKLGNIGVGSPDRLLYVKE